MNKIKLVDLKSSNTVDFVDVDLHKDIVGGGTFSDGKIGSSEQEFIDIVAKAVTDKPGAFAPKFEDPEFISGLQKDYPDIHNAIYG